MATRIKVSSLAVDQEAQEAGVYINGCDCEVQAVCDGTTLGQVNYQQGGQWYENFVPYVVLAGSTGQTLVVCSDCDGWLADVYRERGSDATPQ